MRNTVMIWIRSILIICIIDSFLAVSSLADVVFIVNSSVTVETVSKTEIKEIFLGDKIVWPDGEEIVLVTLNSSVTHEMFTRKYARKSKDQFLRYWRKLVFTGKAYSPKSFATEKQVIEFVKRTKGAIGYISDKMAAPGVKVLKIADK